MASSSPTSPDTGPPGRASRGGVALVAVAELALWNDGADGNRLAPVPLDRRRLGVTGLAVAVDLAVALVVLGSSGSGGPVLSLIGIALVAALLGLVVVGVTRPRPAGR